MFACLSILFSCIFLVDGLIRLVRRMGDEQLVETKFFVSLVLTYLLLFTAMILGGVSENLFPLKANETLFSVMLINFVT